MRKTRNFLSHEGVRDYFIGDILKFEEDSLRAANVIMVFYVSISALILLIFLQVMCLIAGADAIQQWVGIASIVVFGGGLFFIRWSQFIVLITDIMFLFSAGVFSLNLWLYPGMNLVNGLHLAANLLFSFHVLSRAKAMFSVVFFLAGVTISIIMTNQGIQLSFITPIKQPILEQIVSFITLLGITLLLIVY
jgi:hypothetical protein